MQIRQTGQMRPELIGRRQFSNGALALLGGAAISAAQLSAGNGITPDISDGSHSHSVILTGAQVMQIAAEARVSVDSSTNPHSNGADPHAHTVTFN